MKRLALISIALLARGVVAQAQSPAEWRPNIAEDNKAATWEETALFITGMLNNASSTAPRALANGRCMLLFHFDSPADAVAAQLRKAEELDHSGHRDEAIREYQSLVKNYPQTLEAQRATVRLNAFGARIAPKPDTIEHDENARQDVQIDFSRIYPLKIVVRNDRIYMGGTNGQRFTVSKDGKPVEQDVNLSATDEEANKRLARAFMHAALSCGGTNAVSPF